MHAGLALGLSEPDVLCLAASAELLHNASLVHDDLQDQDGMRRGAPAVWKKYGSNVAICTGDLMLSAAYAALSVILVPRSPSVAVSASPAGKPAMPTADLLRGKPIPAGSVLL